MHITLTKLSTKILMLIFFYLLNINLLITATREPKRQQKVVEDSNLIVELSNGKLRGRDQLYFYSYESIPYAEPPVGQSRYEVPRMYKQQWNQTFDATKEPVLCMQWDQFYETKPRSGNRLHGVEDCLTINIYKPKGVELQTKLPVIVLMHGGSFMYGSTIANGHENFMRSGRVIVAKMSYRLGPLGFLSTEDNVLPGNYGLKDIRLALRWLKENIGHFGGDAEKMLPLGFSSGGATVHLQMLQPDFAKYAKAAASFSGVAFNPWVITHNARAHAQAMAKNLGCPHLDNSTMIKQCLKTLPAEAIVRGVRNFLVFGYNPFTTFGPVIEPIDAEDAFLTQTPEAIISSGNFTQIPWLVSYAMQDGAYNAAELLQKTPPHDEELMEVLTERWYDVAPYMLFYKDAMTSVEELDDYSMYLKQHYMGVKNFTVENYRNLQHMFTDVLYKNGIEKTLRLHSKHGKSPVFAYVYENSGEQGIGTDLARRTDIKLGTNHGDDFFLIFNNNFRYQKIRDDERIILQKFIKMLEDFIVNSTELTYGSCKFVDNVGKDNFQFTLITKEGCENKDAATLPSE